MLEGTWPGDTIVIAFPDRDKARGGYGTVSEDHKATDVVKN